MERAATTASPWGGSARGPGRTFGASAAQSGPLKPAPTTLQVTQLMQFANVEAIRYNHHLFLKNIIS